MLLHTNMIHVSIVSLDISEWLTYDLRGAEQSLAVYGHESSWFFNMHPMARRNYDQLRQFNLSFTLYIPLPKLSLPLNSISYTWQNG